VIKVAYCTFDSHGHLLYIVYNVTVFSLDHAFCSLP